MSYNKKMDKVTDITEKLARQKAETEVKTNVNTPSKTVQNSTNPILKKFMQFKNDKLSKKFDINDLLR